jgi:Ca2+-binding EF-hand superfamily protein
MRLAHDPKAVRGAVLDGSSKIRDAFIRADAQVRRRPPAPPSPPPRSWPAGRAAPRLTALARAPRRARQMTGLIAPYRVIDCFRCAGLEFEDVGAVIRQFTRADQRFQWKRFCEELERRTRKYNTLSSAPPTIPMGTPTHTLPPLLRVATSLGSLPAFNADGSPLGRRGRAPSKSLLLKPPHPLGFQVPPGARGPRLPRMHSSGGLRASTSLDSIVSRQEERAAKVKRLFTTADLRAAQMHGELRARLDKAERLAASRSEAKLRAAKRKEEAALASEQAAADAAALAALPPPPAAPTADEQKRAANRQKLRTSSFVGSASDALNSRFTDMFKAFQYVDLDRSGTLNKKEISRALDMWNIPMDDAKLDELIAACDVDGDGDVDYKEFVDVLARDTVAPAAMGKRDMQSKEAMGVDAQEMMAQQLGHGGIKKYNVSINAPTHDGARRSGTPQQAPRGAATAASVPSATVKPAVDKQKLKNSSFVRGASDALNSRFSDMFKAFQYVDLDRSGTLDKKEILRALDMWNIPMDDAKLDELISACDVDGDGQVDYK